MTEQETVNQTPVNPIAQTPETQQQQPAETVEQMNWRKFRMEREEERKAKAAAEEFARKKQEENIALQKALEAVVSKPLSQQQEEVELSDDQRIELKVQAALKKREQELEQQRIERERQELPTRLNQTYKDFNQICTTENLDYLEYHYPEVARAYRHMPEGFDKWEGIYQACKKFIPNKESGKEAKKAEANLTKPQSMTKGGMTQTGDHAPHIIDDNRRAANWARMQKVLKGI